MAYRGGDLDLRTPRVTAPKAPDPTYEAEQVRPRIPVSAGPIYVDEMVLSCVNHAFDVALAHRSPEVRLEHLLHALTRIEPAADELEQRGVRVSLLRRETATAIASEIPTGFSNGRAQPQRSHELEHVLRVASGIAGRRDQAAGLGDIVHVILDVERDLPGLALLAGALQRPQHVAEPQDYARGGYVLPDPRYAETPERARPAPSTYADAPRPARARYGSGYGDAPSASRLDSIEQLVRALSADVAAERKAIAGIAQAVERDLSDRIQGLLDERIAQIDRAVSSGVERLLDTVRDVESRQSGLSPATLEQMSKRLELIEEAVLSIEGERTLADVAQRVGAIEASLALDRTRNAEAGAALRGEIGALSEGLARHHAEIATAVVQPVADGMKDYLAAQDSRQAEALARLVDRVDALPARSEELFGDYSLRSEKIVAEFAAKAEGQTNQLAARIEELAVRSSEIFGGYQARTQELQEASRADLKEMHEALMKLNANQHTLAQAIELWRGEARQTLSALSGEIRTVTPQLATFADRFASVEGNASRAAGMMEAMSGTVDRMHRVTVERYYRRNRFWYWLFGTDDWVAASWPSQAQRITDELKSVRGQETRR
ncbi:MAG: hypothetical protein NW216_03200 [Hyphomicrobium sp.]|nr:hypothetical protein [Hyphomicrobium sp.]